MVRELSTYAELCALAPEWSELWTRALGATPFSSPEWLLPWWRHLFRGGAMWTIAVYDRQRLTGLAPMFIHGVPEEPRKVSFIGSGITDYLEFLVEDADAARQIWRHIASVGDRWDICDFQEIPAGSPTLLCSPPDSGRSVSSICPLVNLPATMAELESRFSRKFRHNLRNSRNRLQALGACFESAKAPEDTEYVEALFRLHAARWNGKGEPGVLDSAAVRGFFRDVITGFRRRGWLRLHGLRFRGELDAVVCIFCAAGRQVYYLGGFDERLSRYSPGSNLIGFAMERAMSEGSAEFDFLREGERYKYEWGAKDRTNFQLRLCNPKSETSALGR